MEEKNKQLLITDLCARLPYGVLVECCGVSGKLDNIWLTHFYNGGNTVVDVNGNTDFFHDSDYFDITKIKPYLRPLETITKEERIELGKEIQKDKITPYGEIKDEGVDNLLLCTIRQSTYFQEWLLSKHFDFRGLIEKGLALAAPEDMYKYENGGEE